MNSKVVCDAIRGGAHAGWQAYYAGGRVAKDMAWIQTQREALRERAKVYLETPIPQLPFRKFQLFWETGDRMSFEKPYFERRGRLMVFSLLQWLEPRADYQEALEETIWAICAEPFWCLPAHYGAYDGKPVPFDEYDIQLDLFSCETAFALSECLALAGETLHERIVQQIKKQVMKRVFVPYLRGDHLYGFEHLANNWSAVCAGAIGGAALIQVEEPQMLTNLLCRCLSGMDVFLDSFGEDGICVEGIGYWNYGFGFFTCFADMLDCYTGGKLNLFAQPKVHAIAKAQQAYYLQGNKTISFSDGSETATYCTGLSCHLQQRYADVQIPPLTLAHNVLDDTCYRMCIVVRDFIWTTPEARFGLPETVEVYYPDAEWFISKRGPFALAAKGGTNAESHNHNDCGSFILMKDGEILLCDLGAGLYTKQYFSDMRYEFFVNASRSHSVAMIDGAEQLPGSQYAAKNITHAIAPEENRFGCDLQACYAVDGLKTYHRTLRHDKAQGQILLEDDFAFDGAGTVTEVFVSHQPFALTDTGAALRSGAVEAALLFDTGAFAAETLAERYLDHHGDEQVAYLLHIRPREAASQIRFELTIR